MFARPLQLSCVNPRRKSFKSKHKFEVHENKDDEASDEEPLPKLTINVLDAVTIQITKHKVKQSNV